MTSGSVPSPAGACYFTSGFSDGYTQSETDDLKAGSEIASLPTINASVVYYKSISYESSKGILYAAPADRLSYNITIPLLAKYVTCDSVDTSDDGRVVLCRYDPSKPIPRMK